MLVTIMLATISLSAFSQSRLKVSENKHFIVKADGSPFFYLGDTAWELFHRLNREEAERFLKNRASKGFTVIQAVALAELDGLNDPNPYGHRPLLNNDPTTPDVKDGANNDYWDHVDFIVKRAGELGMYIGFLPTWGDKWNRGRGAGPEVFNPQNAAAYGEWIGKRYKDATNIIWILGGDRGRPRGPPSRRRCRSPRSRRRRGAPPRGSTRDGPFRQSVLRPRPGGRPAP